MAPSSILGVGERLVVHPPLWPGRKKMSRWTHFLLDISRFFIFLLAFYQAGGGNVVEVKKKIPLCLSCWPSPAEPANLGLDFRSICRSAGLELLWTSEDRQSLMLRRTEVSSHQLCDHLVLVSKAVEWSRLALTAHFTVHRKCHFLEHRGSKQNEFSYKCWLLQTSQLCSFPAIL